MQFTLVDILGFLFQHKPPDDAVEQTVTKRTSQYRHDIGVETYRVPSEMTRWIFGNMKQLLGNSLGQVYIFRSFFMEDTGDLTHEVVIGFDPCFRRFFDLTLKIRRRITELHGTNRDVEIEQFVRHTF